MPMLSPVLLYLALNQTQPPTTQEPRFIAERNFQLKDIPTAKISFKEKHQMTAWVMDTNMKRAEGMMFVKENDFTEKQAMIFVFRYPQILSFWMRNTHVDLDIAYVDGAGRIVKTYTMKAFDETTDYSSKLNAMFAIEVKAGLFKKLGIEAGDFVQIPSSVKAKE